MKTTTIKKWFWVHRWTSLVCTLFLLMLCVTGLPIIFRAEIFEWQKPPVPLPALTGSANQSVVPLDVMKDAALKRYPGHIIEAIGLDDDEPRVTVSMEGPETGKEDSDHYLQFDARTGRVLYDSLSGRTMPTPITVLVGQMRLLHITLFMGLGGELFLGFMGLLFVFSILSGIFLYGPFMKKLDFGTVRKKQLSRLKWLDLHNLLGIATAVWMLVVGFTGFLNELSTPLFGLYQLQESARQLKPYQGKQVPALNELSSVQAALDTVRKALPDMQVLSVIYPTKRISPYHYLVWTVGKTPATSRLLYPAIVDAGTGRLTAIIRMPWYLRAIELSRPLHFGDYGGMPLKIIWALFDLVAIVVLISGIYLWIIRRKIYQSFFNNYN